MALEVNDKLVYLVSFNKIEYKKANKKCNVILSCFSKSDFFIWIKHKFGLTFILEKRMETLHFFVFSG